MLFYSEVYGHRLSEVVFTVLHEDCSLRLNFLNWNQSSDFQIRSDSLNFAAIIF